MSNPHPTITFRANFELLKTEVIGPVTNESNPTILHPDNFAGSHAEMLVEKGNRKNTILGEVTIHVNHTYKNVKHGDEFTVSGLDAIYVRNTYAVGYAPADRAFLEVV